MKIRLGYVSNSSSSSFVVSADSYKTVYDLAKEMISIREQDYREWFGEEHSINFEDIKTLDNGIRDGRNTNEPVWFRTCNYDTFILKIGEYYLVLTSNNHSFLGTIKGVQSSIPLQVIKWLKDNHYWLSDANYSLDEMIRSWDIQCSESFFLISHNIKASKYDYFKEEVEDPFCKCEGHHTQKVVLASNQEIVCPVCYNRKRKNES